MTLLSNWQNTIGWSRPQSSASIKIMVVSLNGEMACNRVYILCMILYLLLWDLSERHVAAVLYKVQYVRFAQTHVLIWCSCNESVLVVVWVKLTAFQSSQHLLLHILPVSRSRIEALMNAGVGIRDFTAYSASISEQAVDMEADIWDSQDICSFMIRSAHT